MRRLRGDDLDDEPRDWRDPPPHDVPCPTVEDSPLETPTGLLDSFGRPIMRRRPTVEWFGFVPLEEKDNE